MHVSGKRASTLLTDLLPRGEGGGGGGGGGEQMNLYDDVKSLL